MTTVSIHQPLYLPWLRFFKKMMNSDIFVIYDDVDFARNMHFNTNSIRDKEKILHLTVPVKKEHGVLIKDAKIDNSHEWAINHKKTIFYNYSKSNYFNNYGNFIEKLYNKKFELLIDLNITIIEFIKKEFNIKTKIYFSSELDISNSPDKILDICKQLNADKYISGTVWAKENLAVEKFLKNKIQVEFQEFVHPTYIQCYDNFIPNLSVIDLLFNNGKIESQKILENSIIKVIK